MTPFCCIDLENIPCQSLPEGVIPEFDHETVKTGNIKDQTKIDEKIALAKQDFDEALDKKMSLDPDLCEVVCFVGGNAEPLFYCDYREKRNIIPVAWDVIKTNYLEHIPIVTYNGIAFDLPVLWHQAMKLNIPVSAQMYSDLTRKYDNHYHYDLQEILAGWDRTKRKSLNFYLKLFGIGEKIGEGSEIYGWWQVQKYEKIKEHCENDVKLTAKLFEKLVPYIVKEI